MRLLWLALILVGWTVNSSVAGPLEDGLAAANKGDLATALELWKPLAEQGNPDAQYNLGLLYENGSGVPRNSTEAMRWYGKAAAQGNTLARAKLDLAYEAARKAQEERKVLEARKAAEQRHAEEQAKRQEEQRKADELKRQEQRMADEAKRRADDAKRRAEEEKQLEELRRKEADLLWNPKRWREQDEARALERDRMEERMRQEKERKLTAEAEATEKALSLPLLTRQHIQVALNAKGFDPGRTDGWLGPTTRNMIEAWQRARNYPATGFFPNQAQVDRLLDEASVDIQKFDEERKRTLLLRQQQQELRQREGGAADGPPMQAPPPVQAPVSPMHSDGPFPPAPPIPTPTAPPEPKPRPKTRMPILLQ